MFLPVKNFFADYFFYRRVIFTDEYSKILFFHKRQHLVFSNLKISLVYLFYWALKLIKTFKLVNQCKRLMFFNSINVFRQPGKKIRSKKYFASDEIFYRRFCRRCLLVLTRLEKLSEYLPSIRLDLISSLLYL